MSQWHFEPDSYLAMVRDEIPTYDELQERLAASTRSIPAQRILDLGSGTGVTARHVLDRHPGAALVGVDGSEEMLVHARAFVPEATFVTGELEGALPDGPFDLVVSAFAVHHLDAVQKAELFARVAAVLAPGGRFALCDVVIPDAEVARPVPLEEGVDQPSTIDDQLVWLAAAGLHPQVVHLHDDLAILVADRADADGERP